MNAAFGSGDAQLGREGGAGGRIRRKGEFRGLARVQMRHAETGLRRV